jgi:hypothetical protein
VIARPIVFSVSLFKGGCCHANVVVYTVCVACCDSCVFALLLFLIMRALCRVMMGFALFMQQL